MKYEEFKRQLGKAGLTAREFAELVRLNPCSVTNYAQQGTVPSHLAVIVTLMGEMADNELDFRPALFRMEIKRNKSRGVAPNGKIGGGTK